MVFMYPQQIYWWLALDTSTLKLQIMPFPVVAAIGAGAALASQGINGAFQSAANKAAMQFQLKMYDRQRADALSDWNMQNQYNSPLAQMSRFKEAGLNPNLIYGQSNSAPSVRSSSAGDYRPVAPQVDLGAVLAQFLNFQSEQNQISLQEKLLELREKELIAKDLAIDEKSQLIPHNVTAAIERNRQTIMNTVTGYNRDNRDWTRIDLQEKSTTQQITESKMRIRKMGQDIMSSQQGIEESKQRIVAMAIRNKLTQEQTKKVTEEIFNTMQSGQLLNYERKAAEYGVNRNVAQKILDAALDVGGGIIEQRFRKPNPVNIYRK